MAGTPVIVTVSEFRRRLAAYIEEVDRGKHPLFVTHYGHVCAVIVSQQEFRAWQQERASRSERREPPLLPSRGDVPPERLRPRESLLPTRKIWTSHGWLDFETAEVMAECGFETELIWTDEGWLTDDEC